MFFRIICQKCGQLLYAGRDMVALYRLRSSDEKCPSCSRKLSFDPLNIKVEDFVETISC